MNYCKYEILALSDISNDIIFRLFHLLYDHEEQVRSGSPREEQLLLPHGGPAPSPAEDAGAKKVSERGNTEEVAVPTPSGKKMGKKKKPDEKKEGPTSLFILRETNFIRRATRFLIEWPPFEYTVLLTIIANCVVLAVETPLPNGDKSEMAISLVSTIFRWCDHDKHSHSHQT